MTTANDSVDEKVTDSRQATAYRLHNVSIRILPTIKAGRTYWLIEDYSTGKRRLLSAKTLPAARKKAHDVATLTLKGQAQVEDLTKPELLSFARAQEMAGPFGIPVCEMVRQWKEATLELGGRASIIDAVKFFLGNGGPDTKPRKVTDAVTELVALKTAQGMSDSHLSSTKHRLNKFASVFGERELHSLTTAEIENFILGLNQGGCSQNHFRRSISNLYVFAQSRGYVRKDFNPCKGVRKAKIQDSEVAHFTPEQMKKLLAACTGRDAGCLPFVLLCGFAGLRPSEAPRVSVTKWMTHTEELIPQDAVLGHSRYVTYRLDMTDDSPRTVGWTVTNSSGGGYTASAGATSYGRVGVLLAQGFPPQIRIMYPLGGVEWRFVIDKSKLIYSAPGRIRDFKYETIISAPPALIPVETYCQSVLVGQDHNETLYPALIPGSALNNVFVRGTGAAAPLIPCTVWMDYYQDSALINPLQLHTNHLHTPPNPNIVPGDGSNRPGGSPHVQARLEVGGQVVPVALRQVARVQRAKARRLPPQMA